MTNHISPEAVTHAAYLHGIAEFLSTLSALSSPELTITADTEIAQLKAAAEWILKQDKKLTDQQTAMTVAMHEAIELEIESLRAELATSETLVATLQEQKYEWDRLTAELAEAKAILKGLEHENSLLKSRPEYKKALNEISQLESALDAVWVNDGKWSYETHQERDTGVQGFTIATGDIESNTYKRLVHNAESPLDAILAAMQEGYETK